MAPDRRGSPTLGRRLRASRDLGDVRLSLNEAVTEVNAWIKEIELVGLLEEEARAAEDAEATSDPDEPLPPHVKVSRGRPPEGIVEATSIGGWRTAQPGGTLAVRERKGESDDMEPGRKLQRDLLL